MKDTQIIADFGDIKLSLSQAESAVPTERYVSVIYKGERMSGVKRIEIDPITPDSHPTITLTLQAINSEHLAN